MLTTICFYFGFMLCLPVYEPEPLDKPPVCTSKCVRPPSPVTVPEWWDDRDHRGRE